jgi:hypothetical protein
MLIIITKKYLDFELEMLYIFLLKIPKKISEDPVINDFNNMRIIIIRTRSRTVCTVNSPFLANFQCR